MTSSELILLHFPLSPPALRPQLRIATALHLPYFRLPPCTPHPPSFTSAPRTASEILVPLPSSIS
ncbi:hypothetical protein BT69DRAFT_868255 [Atractiella rhizophila]|nr:hypothetical protein BT69DRAFT_868255 [Atractiella rhizophila]